MNKYPYSLNLEKYILGSMFIDKICAEYALNLTELDFYNNEHIKILESIKELLSKDITIDIITLSNKHDIAYLTSLVDSVDTTSSFKHHFEELKAYTLRRQLFKASISIQELVSENNFIDAVTIKNESMKLIDVDVGSKKNDKTLADVMLLCLKNIEYRMNNDSKKLYTDFIDLDKRTAGLHKQELTVIAARPGIGKTAFALQLAINLSKKDNQIVFFSAEMSENQLGERLISNLSEIDSQKIRFSKTLDNKDFMNISRTVGKISEMPIIIFDNIINVEEIRLKCREIKNKGKLDVIIVDYLQLYKTLIKTNMREQEISKMSREFKLISKELDVPVILLSQLNRDIEKEKRMPRLSDLRESGAIEQDADNVWFLHVLESADELLPEFDIKLIVAKQRNGPTGSITLSYKKSNFKFINKSKPWVEIAQEAVNESM